jgi:hypothetical protein
MNFLFRYQYPLLPLTCVLAGGLLRDLKSPPRKAQLAFAALSLALAVWLLPSLHPGGLRAWRLPILRPTIEASAPKNGPYDIATALAPFHGYTMVTTEAGILPLYSGWRAVDAWGLNDPVIAHVGLSDVYLDENHPALVVIHSALNPAGSLGVGWGRWDQMTASLRRYVTGRGYVLAAAFGDTPTFVLLLYVDPHIRDAAAIVNAIRKVEFATNFAPIPVLPDRTHTP